VRNGNPVSPQRAFALFAALLTACVVDDVTFKEDTPVAVELCGLAGDEDGNGVADCEDDACGSFQACAAVCRNETKERGEECDTGGNTASCDSDCTAPACNDGVYNPAAEDADPPTSASVTVPMNNSTCRYDFSSIRQLYCANNCSWGGAAGCQKDDADIFCKIKTGNPASLATDFQTGQAIAAPGLCCPSADPAMTGCTQLGVLINRGVMLPVSVHEINLRTTHGTGQVVFDVICTP
jgi:hypothetical protein